MVGSPHPGGEEAPKGLAVRQLKWYASWVQTVVLPNKYKTLSSLVIAQSEPAMRVIQSNTWFFRQQKVPTLQSGSRPKRREIVEPTITAVILVAGSL